MEEIVGEIEDEFDIDENDGAIYAMADGKSWRVAGNTEVERVAEHFEINLQAEGETQRFDTIAGLIAHELGHVPKRGEFYEKAGLRFTALHTVSGTVKWLKVTRI